METIQDCIQSINQSLRQRPSQPIISESPRPFVIQKPAEDILRELCLVMDTQIKRRHMEDLFIVDSNNYESIWQVALWLAFDKRFPMDLFKGLMIQGNPGTGKTVLMLAISEIIMRECMKSLRVIPSTIMVRSYQQSNYERMESYQNGFVCIDDLGSEQVNIMIFGSNVSPISEVIAGRYSSGRITFATSNLTGSQMESAYSTRIFERIKEMMNGIVLAGKTRRK